MCDTRRRSEREARGSRFLDQTSRAELGEDEYERRKWGGGLWLTALLSVLLACMQDDDRGQGRDPRLLPDPNNPNPPARHPRRWLFSRPEFLSSRGMFIFRHVGLRSWFRYVFLDLSHHEADCRWAAFMRRLGVAA